MDNDLELKWDKNEQDFIEAITEAGKKQVEKPSIEEYLRFLDEIGAGKVSSPTPRLTDRQFVL